MEVGHGVADVGGLYNSHRPERTLYIRSGVADWSRISGADDWWMRGRRQRYREHKLSFNEKKIYDISKIDRESSCFC
jgi:hypothetical protein